MLTQSKKKNKCAHTQKLKQQLNASKQICIHLRTNEAIHFGLKEFDLVWKKTLHEYLLLFIYLPFLFRFPVPNFSC